MKNKSIVWGIVIIALGVIFGGNALGFFNFDVFFDGWWTLFIIIPSLISFFTEKEKLASLGFLAVGVVFLLAAQDVFSYDSAWKVALAIFLIMVGLNIIVKSVFRNKNDEEVAKKVKDFENDKTMDSQTAIFSSSERVHENEIFSGSNLVAIFGGATLDLRKARFEKDAVIKAFALFGGIDIVVPDDIKIKLRSGFIFGGFSDDRKNIGGKGKHTIYIDAAGGFGGVSIKDRSEK